jgi:hypothetical protein
MLGIYFFGDTQVDLWCGFSSFFVHDYSFDSILCSENSTFEEAKHWVAELSANDTADKVLSLAQKIAPYQPRRLTFVVNDKTSYESIAESLLTNSYFSHEYPDKHASC